MNYIKQVNTFYRILQENPLSANAQCLYNYLLNKDSEFGWKSEFSISNLVVCGITSLSRQALDRARNELVQKGYIQYKKGRSNQAGKYLIVSFVTQDDTQYNTQSDTQDDTQDGHKVSTLNKLKETKQNETKNKKEKNKKKNETEFDQLINQNFSDEELKNTVYEFIKMRKAIKKSLTTKGLELLIKKLYTLSTNVDEQIKILNNSIMNNWQGIYPLKQELKSKNKSGIDDFKELWEEAKKEDEQSGNSTSNNTFGW
ncbi:MAG: hypothetical protein UE116_06295 [Clostridia bacterium]|nr:hypothetical protein [Clostridia bacterium]